MSNIEQFLTDRPELGENSLKGDVRTETYGPDGVFVIEDFIKGNAPAHLEKQFGYLNNLSDSNREKLK